MDHQSSVIAIGPQPRHSSNHQPRLDFDREQDAADISHSRLEEVSESEAQNGEVKDGSDEHLHGTTFGASH